MPHPPFSEHQYRKPNIQRGIFYNQLIFKKDMKEGLTQKVSFFFCVGGGKFRRITTEN